MFFRKCLVYIKHRWLAGAGGNFLLKVSLILAAAIIASIFLDVMSAFTLLWNFARAVLVVIQAPLFFTIGYCVVLSYGRMKLTEENYEPIREKHSLIVRRRAAVIAGSFVVLVALILGQNAVYTIISSILVACVIGIFAFIRPTQQELLMLEVGVADPRDYDINLKIEKIKSERAKKLREVEENKEENLLSKLKHSI